MQQAVFCAALALLPALAQTPADKPTFEVASVKPAPPPTPGPFRTGMRGGPESSDPGQATFSNVNQRFLLATAYNVQDYQISGPGFLDIERYNVVAKVPKGATKEQFRLMLQDLLAERFHMTLHRETKQLPLYALVVAKSGPKMKKADPPKTAGDAEASDGPDAAGGPPPGPPPGGGGGPGGPPPGEGGVGRPPMGKDGLPMMPPGLAGRTGVFVMMMRGRAHIVGNAQPISKLAETLQRMMGHPVADKTGLSATYDFTLDFDPDGLVSGTRGMMRPPGGGPGGGGPGGGPGASGGGGQGPDANQPDSDAPSLFDALQQQLGLKLEQKKGSLDLLVVDHSEKVPVED